MDQLNQIKALVSSICMKMGKNQASDYDGIENVDDVILYLKSIERDLPSKSLTEKYIVS